MFSSLILESGNSAPSAENRIGDGVYSVAYGELSDVFEKLDEYLEHCEVSAECFPAFRCSNNTFGAVFLLWALCRERNILLTPPSTAQEKESGRHVEAPEFCRHVVSIEFSAGQAGLLNPASWLRVERNPLHRQEAAVAAARPLVCLRTSGSMASPKLVMHSAAKMVANVMPCIDRFQLTATDRITIPVPIFHLYGLGAGFLPGAIVGASIDLQQNTNLIRFLDREREFDPNKAFLTPGLCEMFLKGRRGGGRRYELVVTAGDRISETNFLRFESGFGRLVNLYGSTELGAIATSDPDKPLEIRARGFLQPMDGVRYRIEELEVKLHSDRESGEIFFNHPAGFLGYFDSGGEPVGQLMGEQDWFASRDLAVSDADGDFRVIGRCDNSVNRGGRLLPLAEVETSMEKMSGVNRAIVVPHGESKRGKGMVAFCIPERSASLEVEAIRKHCFASLPVYAIPDRILVIREPPRLANGKIDLQALAENFVPREIEL